MYTQKLTLLSCQIFVRYPSKGRSIDEENIPWNRIRAPPIDTLPNSLHNSDCLNDLKPGDHIEIQWRKAAEFSYGA